MNSGEKYTLIVSLNAAVDRIIYLPKFTPGQINQAQQTLDQAGGKGVNVARALTALGHKVLLIGFTGGITGQQIRDDLIHSHIPCSLIPILGRSRNCYILIDQASGYHTVINEGGPEISGAEYKQFSQELHRRLENAQLLICSGSLPKGVPPSCYAQFIEMAREKGVKTLVDASNEPLRLAVAAQPYLIKPNREEASQLLGHDIFDNEALAAAQAIRTLGAEVGLLSLGDSGAVAAWDQGETFIPAPQIHAINTIACGDAFLAGCAAAILNQQPVAEMLRWGIAAGSANARVGGARITYNDFAELLYQIQS